MIKKRCIILLKKKKEKEENNPETWMQRRFLHHVTTLRIVRYCIQEMTQKIYAGADILRQRRA